MPAWIHNRQKHLKRRNPSMPESQAWAIATQQAHASGNSPKGYGTTEGRRTANQKYDKPARDYKQTANPSHKSKKASVNLSLWKGFSDELQKIAALSIAPTRPVGVSEVTRLALPKHRAQSYSRPAKEPSPPAPIHDHLQSAKTIVPPPVTAAGV